MKLDHLEKRVTEMEKVMKRLMGSRVGVAGQPSRRPLPELAKVVAVGQAREVAEVRGRTGIVMDAHQSSGIWTYTVYFPARQEALIVDEASLWDTGETVPDDVIYGGGKALTVRVDRKGKSEVIT